MIFTLEVIESVFLFHFNQNLVILGLTSCSQTSSSGSVVELQHLLYSGSRSRCYCQVWCSRYNTPPLHFPTLPVSFVLFAALEGGS